MGPLIIFVDGFENFDGTVAEGKSQRVGLADQENVGGVPSPRNSTLNAERPTLNAQVANPRIWH